jgi:cob(I)alamin adenosyltransferase
VRIYTRTGDAGETSLGSGQRVPKSHPRVQSYGELDEVNSWVGAVRAFGVPEEADHHLERVQRALFSLGAVLAGSRRSGLSADAQDVGWLERWIDRMSEELPQLANFILPGGCPAASLAHVARTVTRRAERAVVAGGLGEETALVAVRFLNRLGDALFVLARWLNYRHGASEILWHE